MTEEIQNEENKEAHEEQKEEVQEEGRENQEEDEDDEDLDAKEKLPFPTAAVVRVMKANMDSEKMIKKDVKIAMNKWLGKMCAQVSKEMNKFPYVMIHKYEFEQAKRIFEDLENFNKEKQRILAHLDAIKHDIRRLERDLGKDEEYEIKVEKKEED